MTSDNLQKEGRSRRSVLLGAAVMAISLLLWLVLNRETLSLVNTESVIPASENVVDPVSEPLATLPKIDASLPARPSPAGNFTLYLQPLQYDGSDAQALARMNDYYAAFAYGLRSVPGLHLVNDEASADFRVTISSLTSADAQHIMLSSEWAVKASVEILNARVSASGPPGTAYVLGMNGDAWRDRAPDSVVTRGPLSGDCEIRTIMPCSPTGIAERQVMALRKKVFPNDGSLQRELEARVLNAALPVRERNMAISDLLSMKVSLSDEMMHEVLLRISRTSEDLDRGNLLALLSGQQRRETIQPLIEVARYDPVSSLRVQAVKQLATDFPQESSVRAALEQIAEDPSNPTLQATAKGVIGGLPDK